MKKSHWIFGASLSVILMYSGANADTQLGNGGDAVVCRNDQQAIISAELFDYYEAPRYYQIDVDLGPETANPYDLAASAIHRIESLDPDRAKRYLTEVAHFPDNAIFLAGVKLNPINDIRNVLAPAHCNIEQLAIQKEPENAAQKRYTIAKDIWDRLSHRDQAGLILHEIIYHEAIGAGKTDSVGARLFNSTLSSSKMFPLDLTNYRALLFKIGFWISPNFELLSSQFGGTFTNSSDCADKDVGTVIFFDKMPEYSNVCLGAYGTPGKIYLLFNHQIETPDVTAIYAATFKDEKAGLFDISSVIIFESEKLISSQCESTHNSNETFTVSSSPRAVFKNNPVQMQWLVTGKGICPEVFLDDVHDFTKATIKSIKGTQPITLTKIYP